MKVCLLCVNGLCNFLMMCHSDECYEYIEIVGGLMNPPFFVLGLIVSDKL